MDYYLDGEKKFGLFASYFYYLIPKLFGIKKSYNFIVDDLANSKAEKIIDIGTGTGDVSILLAKKKRNINIYAIDPSKYMINIAKSQAKNTNIVFKLGSSRYIPFKEKFDIIFSSFSFHCWAKKEESLIYLSKFLKQNGEIKIYELNKDSLMAKFLPTLTISEKDIIKIVKKCNLKIKNIKKEKNIICVTIVKNNN
ncbi:MAG: class I SAM-dependent methyltransferase [Candidatus Micrarchaeia archaeon]